MRFVDFDACRRVGLRGYRGNAGRKQAYILDGEIWMVKFPKSTREFQGENLPSYITSPVSEYIGSQIYAALGIPVHETVLGTCQGKVVAGCKDFAVNAELMEFSQIKNTMDEDSISGSYGSSAKGERLSDVLRVIRLSEPFEGLREEMLARFWDMFVTDAFILNNDRNNGNWGLLLNPYTVSPAPVYDNGNALFNKRTLSVMEKRLGDERLIREDVLTGVSFFLDDEDRHIHPFSFIRDTDDAACRQALKRFADRADMKKICSIIEDIPEFYSGLQVLPSVQKQFYKEILECSRRLLLEMV